jgi:hypothetical protein
MTSINDLFGDRVLEFTRAEAILKALVVDIDNMQSSLGTTLAKRDETLAAQLAAFRASAIDQWLKGTGAGMDSNNYEHARNAAIGRARSLERRAHDAAVAAAALATLLEHTEPLITPEDLIWRIDRLSTQFYDAKYNTDADAEADLISMWQALTPSPLVSPEAVEVLRRHYDAKITGPYPGGNLPTLYPAVTAWRENHLSAGAWDAGTWEYAVATLRSWDEAMGMWGVLSDTRRGDISPAQNMRLRTAIADRVKESPTPKEKGTNPPLFELSEAVTEFDNAHMWLMTRIRSSETMADLKIVADIVTGRSRDIDGGIILMRAVARKYDALTTTATDADPEGDDWHPAAIVHQMVKAWRTDIAQAALECTTARGTTDYTEEQRYKLLDCALGDARHTGAATTTAALLGAIARVADAGAEHILTADHIARLRAAVSQGDTAAIELNGGTSQ